MTGAGGLADFALCTTGGALAAAGVGGGGGSLGPQRYLWSIGYTAFGNQESTSTASSLPLSSSASRSASARGCV